MPFNPYAHNSDAELEAMAAKLLDDARNAPSPGVGTYSDAWARKSDEYAAVKREIERRRMEIR